MPSISLENEVYLTDGNVNAKLLKVNLHGGGNNPIESILMKALVEENRIKIGTETDLNPGILDFLLKPDKTPESLQDLLTAPLNNRLKPSHLTTGLLFTYRLHEPIQMLLDRLDLSIGKHVDWLGSGQAIVELGADEWVGGFPVFLC